MNEPHFLTICVIKTHHILDWTDRASVSKDKNFIMRMLYSDYLY